MKLCTVTKVNVLQAQETIVTGKEENTWTVLPSCEFTLEMRVKSIENAVLVCTWLTNLVLFLNYYYLFNIHELRKLFRNCSNISMECSLFLACSAIQAS